MMLVMVHAVRTLFSPMLGGIPMKNRITEMLKISHPIALGGMAGVTDAPLVASVSEAGGLGTLGAFKETAESLQQQIRQLNALTRKPFAVNIPCTPETMHLARSDKQFAGKWQMVTRSGKIKIHCKMRG